MRHLLTAALIYLVFSVSAGSSQTPVVSPTPPVVDDKDVVVITTNLIRVDATVTDKKGKVVADLTADDFEIYENGEKRRITDFSFVGAANTAAEKTSVAEKSTERAANQPPLPPVPTKLRPEQVRRTIALVVDDLGLSFESTHFVREALKQFVNEQMQPNDLVAIIRTGGGMGALQQFTSDKRQLFAAIEKVRWNPIGRAGIAAFEPIEQTFNEMVEQAKGAAGGSGNDESELQKRNSSLMGGVEAQRHDIFTVGTLGALSFIIKGMGDLPGRKAVLLLSDGFRLFNRTTDGGSDQNLRILESLRRLTDSANRAAVVINTVDARGLQTLGFNAADNLSGLTSEQIEQRLTDRRNELFDTQEGLNYLAQQTGGRAIRNNNDIKGSIEKILDDQKGYYLLGYEPDDATFDPAKVRFNKLTVKVKRPDLNVRYRSGFLGMTDETAGATRKVDLTPNQRLISALTSPFGASEIGLRLNALFGDEPKTGAFIRALVHVNGKDLKYTDEPNGEKKAVFDIVAYTFGDNGVPVDSVNKTYTMRVKDDDTFVRLLQKGFVYYINVPIKKPGAYQLRVALRDVQDEKIGAANQFIEVPNLKKKRLTLSGIVLQNMTAEQFDKFSQNKTAAAQTATAAKDDDAPDTQTDTALRRFRRGTILHYAYEIYNAQASGGSAATRPQPEAQTRLFRDGKQIFAGNPTPINLDFQTDLSRIKAQSAIVLATTLEPGAYVLQVVVKDKLAKEKRQIATQWVEFELIN